MRLPCDAVIRSTGLGVVPCGKEAGNWILAATILASSMAFIDSTVVNVALPAVQATFHATVIDVQWVIESYGLLLGSLILVGGSLGDLFGRRRVFVTGVGIFAAASAGCGLASNIHLLILARSIQGIGAALLVPGSLAIISTSFDEKSRGRAIGTWSGFTAMTTAVGPVLGGWLVEHASWRWAFFINIPFAAAVIIISVWRIPESHSATATRVDWAGAVFASTGLVGLVYGFIESARLGWGNPMVFGSLIAGSGCLIAFIFIERRVTTPMVPLSLFESRGFSGANLLTLFLYSAIGIFFFLFPLNLIQVQGYSATAAGAAVLPLILLMFLLSRWSGGLVARYGPRLPLIIGPFVSAVGFVLFAITSVGDSYWRAFLPAVVVLGCGMSITVAPLTTLVMNSIAEDRVGAASGINNSIARVAGVLAIAVLGIVMVSAFSSRLNRSLTHLSLPPAISQQVHANEIKLAGLPIPAGVAPDAKTALKRSIAEAFAFGFRVIMFICACLSLASMTVAARMIPSGAIGHVSSQKAGLPFTHSQRPAA
jgi:EmrB/QacA subfamily drug resistance transporter